MNFTLRLRKKRIAVESVLWYESETIPGVRYAVREPSLGNRIALTKNLHELTIRNEFLAAGHEMQQLELAMAELMVQKTLLEWGLAAIEGLAIDGHEADVASLVEAGPEVLVSEIAATIRGRCGLSEDERKN